MEPSFRFNLPEIAGALGDYGTLLPIIIGVAAVTEANLSYMLFFFAISYILTGLYYRLPVPVEPMKVIGVLAITGRLTSTEIASAGIMMGLILFLFAITGGIHLMKRIVPTCIVRGIQLGLAFTLMLEALKFIAEDSLFGLLCMGLIMIFTLAPLVDVSALVVFMLGLSFGLYQYGTPPLTLLTWPRLMSFTLADFWAGFFHGALPQLPLTLGNAVLATSLLISDLFNRRVPEKKLLVSMGFMCIISSPFGGFPMCHGASGLAAQYRFGARTGASNIISGVILLLGAFFFATPEILKFIPFGALGALLFFSSLELLKSAVKTDHLSMTIMTGLLAPFTGMAVAFVVMLLFYYFLKNIKERGLHHS